MVLLLTASELSPMLRLPPLLLILAALVFLLILLSCCIVIVIRSQEGRRRKKHYVYKSKESLEKNPDIIPNKDGERVMKYFSISITTNLCWRYLTDRHPAVAIVIYISSDEKENSFASYFGSFVPFPSFYRIRRIGRGKRNFRFKKNQTELISADHVKEFCAVRT